MLGIVTTVCNKQNFSFALLHPYRKTKDRIGEEEVTVYTLQKVWKPFFPKILQHLHKEHDSLIYSEQMNPEKPSLALLFFNRLREILALNYRGIPQKIAILSWEEDPRILSLLEMVSPFSQSVSIVTHNNIWFDKVSENALLELGLTLNQRSRVPTEQVDLLILLSGEFDLTNLQQGCFINLSRNPAICNLPALDGITNSEVSAFLARHPGLQINPTLLLPKSAKITNLIWKYC